MKAVIAIVFLMCSVGFCGGSRCVGFIESFSIEKIARAEFYPFYNITLDDEGWGMYCEYAIKITASDSYGNKVTGNHFIACIRNYERFNTPNTIPAIVIISSMNGSSGGWSFGQFPADSAGDAKFKIMVLFDSCQYPKVIEQFDSYKVYLQKKPTAAEYQNTAIWKKAKWWTPALFFAMIFMDSSIIVEGQQSSLSMATSMIAAVTIDSNGIEWPDMIAGYFDVLDANTARDLKSYTVSFEADGRDTIPIFLVGTDANGFPIKTFCSAKKVGDTYITDRFFPTEDDMRQVFVDSNGVTYRTVQTKTSLDIELIRLQDFMAHWLEAGGDYDLNGDGRVNMLDYAILTRNMN